MSFQLALPKTEFFQQINQLIVSNLPPDNRTLTQFQNEIQKQEQFDDFDNYLLRGTLAHLEGDIDAIHTNYQQAIAVSSATHANVLKLYAKCLAPFGFFSPATDLMHQAYNFDRNDFNLLEDAIHFSGLAGRFHQVGELLKIRDDVNPEPDKAHKFSPLASNIIEFMDKQNVSDQDLEGLIDIAMSILRQNKLTVVPDKIEVDLFYGEEQWFHYGIPLQESVGKVVDFNFELAERSIEECPTAIIMGNFEPLFQAVGDE